MTKITLFPAKSKCVNTSSTVKMQRFAADGVGRVLYYEVGDEGEGHSRHNRVLGADS